MSIITRIHHNCYDHYELTSYEKLFTCDGCKMKGFGQRYLCSLCGNERHRECRYPQSTISHDNFGPSIFTFRDEPFTRYNPKTKRREYSKLCDACGKEINGFSYHCETENLDLHPCCRNLETKLLIDDKVFDLQAKASSSRCVWCKKRKISDGGRDVPGWSYVSPCRKYRFHVHCMAEMVQESCIRNGEMMGLEKVDLRNLVKSRRSKTGSGAMFETVKMVLKIILAAILGDPTALISNVIVELVSRGFQ